MFPKQIKAAILDFDQTITPLAVDWSKLKKTLSNHLLNKNLQLETSLGIDQALWKIKDRHPLIFQELLKIIQEEESKGFAKVVHRSLFQELSLRKIEIIGIFSANTSAAIRHILNSPEFQTHLTHLHLFSKALHIVGKEDVSQPKPHPDGLLKIIEKTSYPLAEIIYIGDSTHDLMAGTDAKVATIQIERMGLKVLNTFFP